MATLFKSILTAAHRLLPEGYGFNIAILTSATVMSQVIAVLASPVLTRIYTSSDFGHLQTYLSISVFFSVTIALRYEAAVLLPAEDETAANLVALSLCAALLMTLVCCAIIAILRGDSVSWAQARALDRCLWVIPISAFATGAYQILNSWALRKQRFRDVALTKMTQASGNVGSQLSLGLLHVGFWGLLIGDVIGRTSGILRLTHRTWVEDRSLFSRLRWSVMWSAAVRYRRFPLVSSGSALINTAGFAIPFLLIGELYGPQVLGLFTLADRLIQAPATLIGTSISQVYMASAAKLMHSDSAGLRLLFRRIAKHLFLISLPPAVIIVFFGPFLFAFLFGAAWREAGYYAILLAPAATIGLVSWPLMPTLLLLERQGTQLKWDIGRCLATLTALYAAHHYHWSARGAIAAYSFTMSGGYLFHLYLSYTATSRHAHISKPDAVTLAPASI